MGILNIGTQALNANLVALQTIGNNIANVNTAGYSRQSVIQTTVAGQYTGAGYIGKGVAVETIQRNYDQFLTRQSTLATATQASDQTRSDYLAQLSSIFQGGTDGIGQSINDMLNSFSDVASTPTDLTARTVALTRIDETTRRMRAASPAPAVAIGSPQVSSPGTWRCPAISASALNGRSSARPSITISTASSPSAATRPKRATSSAHPRHSGGSSWSTM